MNVSASAPSTPLEDRMGPLIRVKARPICEYKNWCEYAALTRLSRPKNARLWCGGGTLYEAKKCKTRIGWGDAARIASACCTEEMQILEEITLDDVRAS